ncbi:metallophosphoesterase [uncultured Paraglaciecola sp.]|uniref:metallophosphoesterase n=1 Tax=uncultured Paraglaciecola sp. TaxID=1765024 RepID=UPI002598653F|nr:metallophosphoesterase [uncultured Paraglaciecola sp.]
MNFQFVTANTAGRDFICGDIHGHFDILEKLLNSHTFNPLIDRLFSLGDLIDRGENSIHVLTWLNKPWFYAVQGNHERMLIDVVESQAEETKQQWLNWGGNWAKDLDENALQDYYKAIMRMPAAIEIALPDGRSVGLVHAELPDKCDWHQVKNMLLNAPKNIEENYAISDMFWNRAQPLYDETRAQQVQPVQNIYHVFHGHTPVNQYKTISNRTFLDLGSYKTGKIGLIDVCEFLN